MARWSRLILIAVVLCALNGCVYLRLFSVKQQCADFDNNFDFGPGPGLTLVFKHPVLLAEDTVTLIGGPPSEIVAAPDAAASGPASGNSHWIFRYRRQAAQEKSAPADVVALDFTIRDGKIERVAFPSQVFAIIPVDLAKAMMRAMGHAHVDQGARTATTQVDVKPGLAPAPDRDGIETLFGAPDKVLTKDDSERRIFRYQLDPPAKTGSATTASAAAPTAIIGIVFKNGFAPAQQFQAGVSGLWLFLELPGAVPAPPKTMPKDMPKPVPEPDYGTANGG